MRLMLAVWLLVGHQEPLDRTLALVGGQPITLSDANGALALGLIDAVPGSTNRIGDATGRLIQRELILREVQRYAPGAPLESVIDARLEVVRKRFADAAAMKRVLDAYGFNEARLRGWLRDDLRTEAYLAQRFASASTPTDADIAREYTESRADYDRRFATFEQATPAIRERLVELRRTQLIIDWVSDLERRTEIVRLPYPQ